MPFTGSYGHGETAYLKKTPERLKEEFLIALEYGGGNLMFATLGVLYEHRDLSQVVRTILGGKEK